MDAVCESFITNAIFYITTIICFFNALLIKVFFDCLSYSAVSCLWQDLLYFVLFVLCFVVVVYLFVFWTQREKKKSQRELGLKCKYAFDV